MELRQLEYFCEAARQEHYSKAAANLFISQPALSRTIKNLEEELGTVLFEPAGRGIRLTPDGKHFYGVANNVLNTLREAQQMYRRRNAPMSSAVTVINEIPDLFPYVLRTFIHEHPAIPIYEVHTGKASQEMLASGAFAFSLSQTPPEQHLNSILLYDNPYLLLTPAQWHLEGRCFADSNSPSELPLIAYSGFHIPKSLELRFQHPSYMVSDIKSVLHLVAQGCGISILPVACWLYLQKESALDFLSLEHPVPLPIGHEKICAPIYLAWSAQKEQSAHEQLFLEHCRVFFSTLSEDVEASGLTRYLL